MRKTTLALLLLFVFAFPAFADSTNTQPVEIVPLYTAISFSTVTLGTSWVTAPTVELRGRKSINILNTSTTDNIYLRSVSSSSVTVITRRLLPQTSVTFRVSSDLHIYLSGSVIGQVAEVTEIK